MRFFLGSSLLLLSSAAAYTPESTAQTDAVAAKSFETLKSAVADGTLKKGARHQRRLARVHHRKRGGPEGIVRYNHAPGFLITSAHAHDHNSADLSDAEKIDYIDAVRCLMTKPSITPPEVVPGARTRYDDFVATHMNLTRTIHMTGNFLTWHRYFVYTWEKALRDECGYKGYQPYWNWVKSSADPIHSPYMDGSPTSQGGNGVYAPHKCTPFVNNSTLCIPQGEGGGCVETGPYGVITANISATSPTFFPDDGDVPVGKMFSYSPRCLKRDISPWMTSQWLTDNHTMELFASPSHDIAVFQDLLQIDQPQGPICVHSAGHFTWNGDPGGDVYNSPGDPMFWLLHANVDRVWWMWQNQAPLERSFRIAGTRTMANEPPSANATLDDWLDMGFNGDRSPVREHVSTVGGPYCYVYA
ncbi:Di-copper centre-containing protein [Apiospora rasikravindrae]|uniref:Di-copper centre-containing protein n=1 Tax=Apiospora rasikravindrae TaxID=990691 RepID=A0ABR1RWY1_9PEZI